MNTIINKDTFFENTISTTNKVQECIEILNIKNMNIHYIHWIPLIDTYVGHVIIKKNIYELTEKEIQLITPESWGYLHTSGLDKLKIFSNIPFENFSEKEFNFLFEKKPELFNIN
jgi:hypothetical protein